MFITNTDINLLLEPQHLLISRGGSRGGSTRHAPPLKLEKIRNTPKMFVPPSAIGRNMIFWRKIMIFHTKYPKNVRASLHNWKKYDFLA